MSASLEIVRAGSLTTIQDCGRPGLAHLAVGASGALDMPAHRLANRLVGNDEAAATLETTLDGVAVRATHRCHVAVTGAVAPITRDDRGVGWSVPIPLHPGQILNVGRATHGVRCYLAVSGGIDTPPTLGSRSTDLLSGLGSAPLHDAEVLPIGTHTNPAALIDFAPYPLPAQGILRLPLHWGPRSDWITPASLRQLASTTWTVTADSNRVGMRLEGPAQQRSITTELPSEGVVLGALQIPADGRPVVFLADHPTTGGYPVIAVIPPPQIWRCAQAAPGTSIQFSPR